MKLYIRLFYVLLIVFVIGVVSLCLVDPSAVWSRIATGLVTGSFVGIVNTLTNYYHARKQYFEKFVLDLLEIEHNLTSDYIEAKSHNAFLSRMSKEQMIQYADEHEQVSDTLDAAKKMKERYENLSSRCDFEAYALLIPWTKKRLRKDLEQIEENISCRVKYLYGFYRQCYDFTLLSSPASKEEQEIVLGNPDDFFELVLQNNKDYEDLLAYCLNLYAELLASLSEDLNGILAKFHLELLSGTTELARVYLKDAVIRDVFTERSNSVSNDSDKDEEDSV